MMCRDTLRDSENEKYTRVTRGHEIQKLTTVMSIFNLLARKGNVLTEDVSRPCEDVVNSV